jgi:predicted secreted Zn-dependent protease
MNTFSTPSQPKDPAQESGAPGASHSAAPFSTVAGGSWYCAGCFSLNRQGADHCYKCRTASPATQVKTAQAARAQVMPGGHKVHSLLIIGVIALVFSSVVTMGLTGKLPTSSAGDNGAPIAAVPASDDPSTTTVLDASPSVDPTPSESPTMKPTPRPTPTPTATPTLAPTPVPTPTSKVPPTTMVKLPSFPVRIPGVSIKYYSITGSDAEGLESSILGGGPVACGMAGAAACFHPSFNWSYSGTMSSNGTCRVTGVRFAATYIITLPKWVGSAYAWPALVSWWKGVLNHLVWHESQHLAIARSYVSKFKAAISAGSCNQGSQNAIVAGVEQKLEAAQNAFDGTDNYSFPPYN